MKLSTSASPALPLVVHLGFAGSRVLYDADEHPDISGQQAEDRVVHYLTGCLGRLRTDLGLSGQHFFCGVSQVAVGADMAFSRVCAALDLPQRVLLPQPLDDYLDARGADGVADFSPDQKARARAFADAAHVLQCSVVSDSGDREDRFEDTAIEIIRASDVMVCLVRVGAEDKQGGTVQAIRRALNRGKAVLRISVAVIDGDLAFEATWHGREAFQRPALPAALEAAGAPGVTLVGPLPDALDYAERLDQLAGPQAQVRSTAFKHSVLIIGGTHVAATFVAALALVLHTEHPTFTLPALLMFELALLVWGFLRHRGLHAAETSQGWAVARLVSALARSIHAVGRYPIVPAYLFTLPLPVSLDPLVATLNVLHLRGSRPRIGRPWQPFRDAYIAERLAGVDGQIAYYEREAGKATTALGWARHLFTAFSIGAICASLLKLSMVTPGLRIDRLMAWATWADAHHDRLTTFIGLFAVTLPLLAVAALSRAAALDLEARANTFQDLSRFLRRQRACLDDAGSKREFAALMLETEHRLLGESAAWFYRRSFTSVT